MEILFLFTDTIVCETVAAICNYCFENDGINDRFAQK